jgi:hypothetical protein
MLSVLHVENRVCSFISGPDRELMDVQLSSEESTSDVDGELDTSSVAVKSSISSVSTVDFTSDSNNEEDSIVVHKRETIDLTLLAEKQALKPQEVVSPESKEIESSENIAPPSHQSLVQYIKTNYLNKILFELDRAFFILDKVYKVCFERRFSGVAFAGIMIAVIGILYFANPVLMVPTSLALTVFYCYVVFHKRIYKKLIYNLLVADQQKIPGDKKLYNKRVKVMYMLLIAATVLCSTLLPAIPFVLTISSITTLMKLVGNSDYFGFYDREKEAILDKDSEDNSKLIKKILFISFISIVGLVSASVFLTSISLFGVPVAIIAQITVLAVTMFINFYYRVAKNKNPDDKDKINNKLWKIVLVIVNLVLFCASVIWDNIKEIYSFIISIIKLDDATAYFGLESNKAKIIAVLISLSVFIPLIMLSNIVFPLFIIVGIGLLLKKKIYEAFKLDVEKTTEMSYNGSEAYVEGINSSYKKIIVIGICLAVVALGIGLFLNGIIPFAFLAIILMALKLDDEIYKSKNRKKADRQFSVGLGSEIQV